MVCYLETVGVVLLAVVGVWLGRMFSRLRPPYWLTGYISPFLLIGVVTLARWFDVLRPLPPFSWAMAKRREFVVMSVACTVLLTTALLRLSLKRQKVILCIFMIVAVMYFSVLPFLLPAVLRSHLEGLATCMDADGINLQGTSYTCGPAAAVTALKRMGIEAQEGEIAVLAYSNPVTGTPPDLLCAALDNRYRDQGLSCEYRFFKSVHELKGTEPNIVAIRFSFMADHYVTVLDVSGSQIVLGDPYRGLRALSLEEFEAIWRYDGIVLTRKTTIDKATH